MNEILNNSVKTSTFSGLILNLDHPLCSLPRSFPKLLLASEGRYFRGGRGGGTGFNGMETKGIDKEIPNKTMKKNEFLPYITSRNEAKKKYDLNKEK